MNIRRVPTKLEKERMKKTQESFLREWQCAADRLGAASRKHNGNLSHIDAIILKGDK